MRMAGLLLAAILAFCSAGVASAQDGAGPCALSEAEQIQDALVARRVAQAGDIAIFESLETGVPRSGCGVWSVKVNADGTVETVERVRGELASANEVAVVGDWLKSFRFRPQSAAWTAVTRVSFTLDE